VPISLPWRAAANGIRASLRYASKKYRVPLTRDLRPVYTAADEAAAASALEDRYPAIVRLWRAHWSEFIPFLAFPPEVRRVIYTTNLIESVNARLRKVTRNRAPGGNRRCRHSRSTSKAGSQPHETRHDHLHRGSDAPDSDPGRAFSDTEVILRPAWSRVKSSQLVFGELARVRQWYRA
jgi:Transposase, Mutator family